MLFYRNDTIKKIEDVTGLAVYNYDYKDGYAYAVNYNGSSYKSGIVNFNGEIIIPVEYDDVLAYSGSDGSRYWANGYFAVEKDGMVGYVTKNGEVTCELKYPKNAFYHCGMAGQCKTSDGIYAIVAADGTVSDGFAYLSALGNGLLWEVRADDLDGVAIVDWHGNVLFENIYNVSMSGDARYLLVQHAYGENPIIYAIDDAPMSEVISAETAYPESEVVESEKEEAGSEQSAEVVEEEPGSEQNAEVVEEAAEEANDGQDADGQGEVGTAKNLSMIA